MNYYNYFTEIEEAFIRRRGKNLLLSPLDWALIETWQQRGIPLHVVLRGIERVFDTVEKQPNRKRSVKSLFYCKEEIEAQYAEWLESQVGGNIEASEMAMSNSNSEESGLFSNETIKLHLERVKIELEDARKNLQGELSEVLERVLNRLSELKSSYQSAETLEESLEKLDALVDEVLLKNFRTVELEKEIEKQMFSYKNKVETHIYERTKELMVLKKLRDWTKIPRLSLFYI